nr:DUF6169 family protein [uncultured Dyadobacter sp.]
MQGVSNSSTPYSFYRNPYTGTYHFDTCHDVVFTVYFAQDASWFPFHPHLADQIYTFGFWSDGSGKEDFRIMATLAKIITEHFESYPDSILTFICDDDDQKQLSRRRKFNGWFLLQSNHQIAKLDKDVWFDGKLKHTSIMLHIGNFYFNQVCQAYKDADTDVTGKMLD